tara:strand:+ start:186 stop:428 length:243 start_codon:yes stop_codon:yes gene_type:complete
MDYNTLLNKLPAETELHYISDSTQFFLDNNLNINDYSKYKYILFEYTIDYLPDTIKSLENNNINYKIEKDYLDLKYILIK